MAIIGKTRTNQPVESVEGASLGTKLYRHTILVKGYDDTREEDNFTIEIVNSSSTPLTADIPSTLGNLLDNASIKNYHGRTGELYPILGVSYTDYNTICIHFINFYNFASESITNHEVYGSEDGDEIELVDTVSEF